MKKIINILVISFFFYTVLGYEYSSPLLDTITSSTSYESTSLLETFTSINGEQIVVSGELRVSNGKITYASYLKVRDAELWGATDVEITVDGVTAATVDKVIVKNSFVAYDVKDFFYDFKNTISMSSASLVTVREYRFPNIKDATFVLNDDGSLRSVEMSALARTDYILPNPFWSGWSTNQAGRAEQNSVYVDNNGLSNYVKNLNKLSLGKIDTDGDGLSDHDEMAKYATDPNNPNTLNDEMTDLDAVKMIISDNLTIDGISVNMFRDTDGDGISDYAEGIYGTDQSKIDTDGDGLSDAEEILKHGTNVTNPDTDEDGIPDRADPFPLINLQKGTTQRNELSDENIIIKADTGEGFKLDFGSDTVSFSTKDNVTFGLGSDEESIGMRPIGESQVSYREKDGVYEFDVKSALVEIHGESLELNSSGRFAFDTINKVSCFKIKAPGRYKNSGDLFNPAFALYIHTEDFEACIRKSRSQALDIPAKASCSQCGYFDFPDKLFWLKGIVEYERPGEFGYEDIIDSTDKTTLVDAKDTQRIIADLHIRSVLGRHYISSFSGPFFIEENNGRISNVARAKPYALRRYETDDFKPKVTVTESLLRQDGKAIVRIYAPSAEQNQSIRLLKNSLARQKG